MGVAVGVKLGVAVAVERGECEMYKGGGGVVTDKYLVTITTLAIIAAILMPRVIAVFIRWTLRQDRVQSGCITVC